jgi:hypothetical protein
MPTVVITDWRGEYFANIDLLGEPVLVRNDRSIDFDWNYQSPGSGVPQDHFSVRWTQSLLFEGGLYRFHIIMDDGARLFVDGELLVADWRTGARREVVRDVQLDGGRHDVELEYLERSGVALVSLWWERVLSYPDWEGQYWSNRDLAGEPTLVRNDREIDFDWQEGAPAPGVPRDDFSARWSRDIDLQAGTYRFQVFVDDGVRLWIDGVLLIDAWYDHSLHELTAEQVLRAGTHRIKLEYYEHLFKAQIRLAWTRVADRSYADWKGEYWDNPDLAGAPILVRNDRDIEFDWWQGSPDPSIPSDWFSARWTREVTFQPGLYRFYAFADDGIRALVGEAVVFDEWHSSRDEVYRTEMAVAGRQTVTVEFYEAEGDARLRAWWRRLGNVPEFYD